MRIAIGSDHRGYEAKNHLASVLRRAGHHVDDFGCFSIASTDYPEVSLKVATAVADGDYEIGLLLGANGMGFCITSNKVRGVRASVAHDPFSARMTREQHHCNVLCLAAEVEGGRTLEGIVNSFIEAKPIVVGRHARRVRMIQEYEASPVMTDAPAVIEIGETRVMITASELSN